MKLGEKIGALIAQIVTPPLNALRITCHGSQLATAKVMNFMRKFCLFKSLTNLEKKKKRQNSVIVKVDWV